MKKKTWNDAPRVIAKRLERSFGWDENRSALVAEVVMDELRSGYGGKTQYLPSHNRAIKVRIQDEFNGRNIPELCKTYGVSASTVRRYVR